MPTRISSREEVARRAHEPYLERGGQDGHDLEDRLRAEAKRMRARGQSVAG